MKKPFTSTFLTGCLAFFLLLAFHTKSNAECHAIFGWEQSPNSLLVTFHDSSTSSFEIVSWFWNFGDTHTSDAHNPTHLYAAPGTYEVCLTIHDNHDCTSTVCHNVVVAAIPPGDCMAAFSYLQTPGTMTVHFTDLSTSSHDITTWHWNFGDGTESNDHNPNHIYAQPGTYQVCLTIHDNSDCNDTHCSTITVVAGNAGDCEAQFEYIQTPNTYTIHFTDQSSSSHDITSWIWNFGDGHDSDQHNPTHTYAAPGTYEVCLTIHDNAGCSDTYCAAVVVAPAIQDCNASFEYEQLQNSLGVHFFDNSTSSYDFSSWHWNFGDAHESNDQNPIHFYAAPGTYLVCLTIHDNTGCEDTYCEEVTVNAVVPGDCMASIEYSQAENSLNVHFFNTSTSEHDIISRFWTFGDGSSGDGNDPHHIYDHPGTYLVCLTIHDNSGCVDTHCDSITVNEVSEGDCMAFFTWWQSEYHLTIHFMDSSSSSHDITTWHWDFGDGHSSNDHNVTHTYAEPGTYEVCLTIHDNGDCNDTYCTVVTVLPVSGGGSCHSLFSFQNEPGSLIVHFTNAATSPHNIILYLWTFGDGGVSDNPNPTHVYENPGTYEVCLTILDDAGCEDSYCHPVTVGASNSECHAVFTAVVDTSGLIVTFTNASTNTTPNTTYYWTFGDGTTSTEENPVHTYLEPDNYTVCLFITDTNTECENHVCHIINAHPFGGIHQSGLYADEQNNERMKEKKNPAMEHFVSIYPNPTAISTTIEYELIESAGVSIELCDVYGLKIRQVTNEIELTGLQRHSVDVTNLNPGIYLIKVRINQEIIIRKIIVTR
ncbi:MAG: PKD domain-containing protein [Saprospiraceae bacterium]